MAKKKKKKFRFSTVGDKSAPTVSASLDGDETRLKIAALLQGGKDLKEALRLAKALYAQQPTAEVERLLVSAYSARVMALLGAGLVKESAALLDIAVEKHSGFRESLNDAILATRASRGDVSYLLNGYDDAGEEQRSAVDAAIRRWVKDPVIVASCAKLPIDHPLRSAARAVAVAFKCVTSRPVTEAEISLPEVSRKSPFAPWKLLVHAIAALYRGDDGVALQFASRVPLGSAPGALATLVETIISESRPAHAGAEAEQLFNKVLSGRVQLMEQMALVEEHLVSRQEISSRQAKAALKATKDLVKEVERHYPEMVIRLRQHLGVRAFMSGLDPGDVRRAMGGTSLKDAYFWRLFAAAHELVLGRCLSTEAALKVLLCINEFSYHAKAEGLIREGTIEEAAVWLKMARALADLPSDILEDCHFALKEMLRPGAKNGLAVYASEQPEEIAVRLKRDRSAEIVLDPGSLFSRAAARAPQREIFLEWYECTKGGAADWREREKVLDAWRRARPEDAEALSLSADLALRRGAVKKALALIREARRHDPMNANLYRTYNRALTASVVRHIKQAKPHLAQADIDELSRRADAADGGQTAYVAALSTVTAISINDEPAARRHFEEAAVGLDDPLAACGLISRIAHQCAIKQTNLKRILPTGSIMTPAGKYAEALARVTGVLKREEMPIGIPEGWESALMSDAKGDLTSLGARALTLIGEAVSAADEPKLLYAVSQSGLRLGVSARARFLLFRSESLPIACYGHRAVLSRAAASLARRQGEPSIANAAASSARRALQQFGRSEVLPQKVVRKLNEEVPDDEILRVVENELRRTKYPMTASADPLEEEYRLIFLEPEECDCPYCRAERGEHVEPYEFDDYEFQEEDDDDDFDDDFDFDGSPEIEELANLFASSFPLAPGKKKKMAAMVEQELGSMRTDELGKMIPELLDMMAGLNGRGVPNSKKNSRRGGGRRG